MKTGKKIWLCIAGILLIALGVYFIINPDVTLVSAATVLGFFTLFTGISKLMFTFRTQAFIPNSGTRMLSALLDIFFGCFFLFNLLGTALSLPFVFAIWVIIEGISGVGGIHIPSANFMQELRRVTEENNVVLILDEIQSGYGRSGKFFAHQHMGIRPDIITVAKGIANGYPFAGVLISPKFTPVYGQLGTTFGGNHLGCALACTVLDVIEEESLVANAARQGEYLMQGLRSMDILGLKELRGRGLMIGIEFEYPYKEVRNRLLYDQHVFTGAAGTNVLRILPPLCITRKECDMFLERFEKAL